MHRRRLHVCFFLALTLPILGTSAAQAQAGAPPAPAASGSPGAAPSTAPPAVDRAPPASDARRPALLPETAPAAPSAAPSPSPSTIVDPAHDQRDLAAQGAQRPGAGDLAGSPQEVFSDDWWGRARPVIELHGYFRTRAELFQNFSLGRHSSTVQGNDAQYLFPPPLDRGYTGVSVGTGQSSTASKSPSQTVNVCGSATSTSKEPSGPCNDQTESGANLRLRLDPEIHISDNLRILTEIDLLDNLVLGTTPDAYAMQPVSTTTGGLASGKSYPTGYQPAPVNGYAPTSFFTTTQGPPTAGVNGWTNSINVQRVWGEYVTPVGELRFGRMPGQWGLGMIENSGSGIDSDYQTNLDRIMFITGIKSMDLYFGGAWDFVSTGPTNANAYSIYGGQPYNNCDLCNVDEWAAFIAHRTNPELQRLSLARGNIVLNGGLYTLFRTQSIDVQPGQTPQTADFSSGTSPLEPRKAWALTPDLWLQLLWQKLRIEAEFATIQGQIGYMTGVNADATNPIRIEQYGLATQTQYRAVEDKLDLQFGFGWASGDPWATSLAPPSGTTPGLRTEANQSGPISTFQFHPDYRVDLIFYRNIMTRVQGSYYFRPSVNYDFIRHTDGEKVGGGAAVIWSRASEFIQTPGHARDLGVELDAQLYYQSKDGSLNDDPTKVGGFYTMLQYGVFFPLAGLQYLPGENADVNLSVAQIVRLFLGIVF
jgi:uncharacterized protein (TIGR04551 family)